MGKLFFEFDFGNKEKNVQVEIRVEEHKTIITCTCMHGTIHLEALCSHKIAVIYFECAKHGGRK